MTFVRGTVAVAATLIVVALGSLAVPTEAVREHFGEGRPAMYDCGPPLAFVVDGAEENWEQFDMRPSPTTIPGQLENEPPRSKHAGCKQSTGGRLRITVLSLLGAVLCLLVAVWLASPPRRTESDPATMR